VPIPLVAKQIGHASPQVTLKVAAYALEGDAHLGRSAVTDIAAKSTSCAPDVHPQAVGQEQNALEARSYCSVTDVPRVGFEPTLDRV